VTAKGNTVSGWIDKNGLTLGTSGPKSGPIVAVPTGWD
jgi:hypothetical protein